MPNYAELQIVSTEGLSGDFSEVLHSERQEYLECGIYATDVLAPMGEVHRNARLIIGKDKSGNKTLSVVGVKGYEGVVDKKSLGHLRFTDIQKLEVQPQ